MKTSKRDNTSWGTTHWLAWYHGEGKIEDFLSGRILMRQNTVPGAVGYLLRKQQFCIFITTLFSHCDDFREGIYGLSEYLTLELLYGH